MFKNTWTSGRTKRDGGYPGNRTSTTTTTTTTTTMRGSTRPNGTSSNGSSGGHHSRQEHLDSYLKDDVLGRSTMKVSQDDTTYDTVFSTVAEDTLILRVHFPAAPFTPGASASTTRAPEMKLTGVVATHAWLDNIGRVTGFDPTSSDRTFRDSGLLLGQAVKQVVQELQLHPPTVSKFVDAHLRKMQPKQKSNNNHQNGSANNVEMSLDSSAPPSYDAAFLNGTSATSSGSTNSHGVFVPSTLQSRGGGDSAVAMSTSSSTAVDLPPIPSQFPELEGMDRDALDELLNDEAAFLAFCHNLPVSQQMRQMVVDKSQETEQLASDNLSREAELQEAHAATRQLHEQLSTVVQTVQTLEQRQDALLEKPEPRLLLKELTKAKRQAFDESEQMADAWLDKGSNCADTMQDFCNSFLEQRKIHHVRAAKIQILSHQQQQPSPSAKKL